MFRKASFTDVEKSAKWKLFTIERGKEYQHLKDKTKRSKMEKTTTIHLCTETIPERRLED